MAKILQFYLINQKIPMPPCTYLKPYDYLIPKSSTYTLHNAAFVSEQPQYEIP